MEQFLEKSRETGVVIVGRSQGLRDALLNASIAAQDPEGLPVLIIGATGTGKELIARAIHASSPRREGIFWPVNCSAIPTHLAESLLFGHKRGAFTSASSDQQGYFVVAKDGTLFLDEILDLPSELQPKLLRAVEYGEVVPLGANQILQCKPRILASITEDSSEKDDKRLREALMYRLAAHLIYLPPLSERNEDISSLVDHFLAPSSFKFSNEAMDVLRVYPWPGNIRELMYVVKRAIIQAKGQGVEKVEPEHLILGLPGRVNRFVSFPSMDAGILFLAKMLLSSEEVTLGGIQDRLIKTVLMECGGNRTKAATALGITTRTIRNFLARQRGDK